MIVEFSRLAAADLRKIGFDTHALGKAVGIAVEQRLREAIAHIAEFPEAGIRIADRPGVRMMPLGRYPYKIFYRVLEDRVRILHLRHSSRQPWTRDRWRIVQRHSRAR